eukprot:1188753-Prorocentrum_minimum.AAC.3
MEGLKWTRGIPPGVLPQGGGVRNNSNSNNSVLPEGGGARVGEAEDGRPRARRALPRHGPREDPADPHLHAPRLPPRAHRHRHRLAKEPPPLLRQVPRGGHPVLLGKSDGQGGGVERVVWSSEAAQGLLGGVEGVLRGKFGKPNDPCGAGCGCLAQHSPARFTPGFTQLGHPARAPTATTRLATIAQPGSHPGSPSSGTQLGHPRQPHARQP